VTRVHSVLITALILVSTVAMGFGPGLVTAQTDTYTQEFTTGPHKVEINLSNVTTETTISVITSGSPAGDNVTIMKKTVSASTPSAHFRNAGAYETFTVQVEGADAEPGFSKGGPTAAWTSGDSGKFLGDTGGDADFTYDLSERIGESVMPQIVQLDRTGLPSSTTVDTEGTDAAQVETDLYQSAQNQKAASEAYQTTLDNYLSDTKTQARIIGKNAYIKALNNGQSKSAAKTEAKNAVADYYATKQVNLINQWNQALSHGEYMRNVQTNESGVTARFTNTVTLGDSNSADQYRDDSGDYVEVETYQHSTNSVSLVNGSSATASVLRIHLYNDYDGTENYDTAGFGDTEIDRDGNILTIHDVRVKSLNSDNGEFAYLDFSEYNRLDSEIESQSNSVQNEMDTLAENTYSAYQAGEINNTDLVDPYVLSNQQSAGEDFQGWAAAQLTLMGTNSPENFDQIGSFNVTTGDGTQYEGVLFSQENPASGQFENGTTYDTANIGGTQYVVTSDQIVELDGTFTIDRITTTNGETTENATIQKTTYETTNVTELKQQYEDLAYRRAQIEAREKALQQSAGGGLLGGGSVPPVVALAVIGTLLGIVVLQN